MIMTRKIMGHIRENGNWQKVAYALVGVLTAVLGFLAVDIHARQARADDRGNLILQRLSGIDSALTAQQAQTNQLQLLMQQVRQDITDHMRAGEGRRP